MDREKIEKYLVLHNKSLNEFANYGEFDHFLLAICYVQLDDFPLANQHFEQACLATLMPFKLWKRSANVNWLVDIWIMSGRKDLYLKIIGELEGFRKDQMRSIANSLLAQYSYLLMDLLRPTGAEPSTWKQNLTDNPRIKDMFAIGQAFQAILDRDTLGINSALDNLLKAHQGKSKYGALRETAEGLLCMSAMSLAYAAYQYGLQVDVKSDYFSTGYLEFLIKLTKG